MSNPTPDAEGGSDPRAEQASARPRADESTRPDAPRDVSRAYEHPEAQLGGADAVEKTTYVVGEGTEPNAQPTGSYVARDAAGEGSIVGWVVGGIAALIALAYVIGIFL
jgi:hypothetical protein